MAAAPNLEQINRTPTNLLAARAKLASQILTEIRREELKLLAALEAERDPKPWKQPIEQASSWWRSKKGRR